MASPFKHLDVAIRRLVDLVGVILVLAALLFAGTTACGPG
jgi:hypothetical protein